MIEQYQIRVVFHQIGSEEYEMNINDYQYIVVGAGFAGATVAQQLSKDSKVLVLEKSNHIGVNCYDYYLEDILIHQYGPHIFHTNNQQVYDYLSEFTEWYPYEHRVLAHIHDHVVPLPFNLLSLEKCFD